MYHRFALIAMQNVFSPSLTCVIKSHYEKSKMHKIPQNDLEYCKVKGTPHMYH